MNRLADVGQQAEESTYKWMENRFRSE